MISAHDWLECRPLLSEQIWKIYVGECFVGCTIFYSVLIIILGVAAILILHCCFGMKFDAGNFFIVCFATIMCVMSIYLDDILANTAGDGFLYILCKVIGKLIAPFSAALLTTAFNHKSKSDIQDPHTNNPKE